MVRHAIFVSALSTALLAPASAAPAASPVVLSVDTHADLATALIRAGLDPEALAAAGVTSSETTTLVGLADQYLQGASSTLSGLDADYAAARKERDELQRLIQSGLGTSQDVTDYQSAAADVADAETARDDFLDGLFDDAAVGLSASEVSTLQAIHGNRHWDLPIQYLVINRTEQAWVDLREALANLEICEKLSEDPDQACVGFVGDADLDTDVAAAASSLDANGAAVTSAWQSAVE